MLLVYHLDFSTSKRNVEEAEVMYNALSEISILKDSDKFDVDVFSQMCQSLEVDPMTAAKVIVAVMSNESGLTLTFEQPPDIVTGKQIGRAHV